MLLDMSIPCARCSRHLQVQLHMSPNLGIQNHSGNRTLTSSPCKARRLLWHPMHPGACLCKMLATQSDGDRLYAHAKYTCCCALEKPFPRLLGRVSYNPGFLLRS